MTLYTPEEAKAIEDEIPMDMLREQRNLLLSETDWWTLSDSAEATAEQLAYRQELRDLPSTSNPKLDENERHKRVLINVDWPVKPT